MTRFLAFILINFILTSNTTSSDIEIFRRNYSKASTDKLLCEDMIVQLTKLKDKEALFLGYLGAYQTAYANHVFSPFSKLKTFKQGKSNIQAAISKDKNDVELRYIRLSIQKNAPSFLGYNDNINEDVNFIKAHLKEVDSKVLLNNIEYLLKK